MKFAIAVVMLVCALAGVQASWNVAHVAPAVSYVSAVAHPAAGHWGGPWGGAWNGAWNGGWNGAWGGHGWAGHGGAWGLTAPGWHAGTPGISLAQGPSGHHAAAAPLHGLHGHEGVYVAKTRGAIHTAPLAGHIASATSVNVAPAPGTL